RLMLHNIAHIKAFWIMQGIGLSQLALNWGCDDLDGTVVWYDITKRGSDGTHQELHVSDIRRLIREAGREPVERDTIYRAVRRDPQLDAGPRRGGLAPARAADVRPGGAAKLRRRTGALPSGSRISRYIRDAGAEEPTCRARADGDDPVPRQLRARHRRPMPG